MAKPAGRPRYRLTDADFGRAVRYIDAARKRGEVNMSEGYHQWLQATTAEALQIWCDDYLPKDVWRRLLITLRQDRKRSRDYRRAPVHRVDLSHAAWVALSRAAKEMGGVTLSEAVLRLEQGYDLAKDAGLLSREEGAR
jgi:macrodomain Ter protein organizer (MatP/YcbG family)